MLTSSKKVSYSYARRLLILPVAIGILVLLSFTIKDSLSDSKHKQVDHAAIPVNKLDSIPAKYRDPKTGKIKGSFQIDIDGDMASFKDIKSKKELFKVPLHELAGPANKVIKVQGYPLDMSKKVIFISGDSLLKYDIEKQGTPRIVINGKVVSPDQLEAIDPSSIKTIDIRGAEKGVAVAESNLTGISWTEATAADGKKIVTLKVDSVIFEGKARAAIPAQGNVSNIHTSIDTSDVITVTGFKKNSNVSTITIRTTDDKVAEKIENDPKTLTFTTTDKDGKKTYTFVQKQTEKTELPKDVLYIMDGKEISRDQMNGISPDKIQSINVLKGENATGKYGDKGKNGVIEIKTKQ